MVSQLVFRMVSGLVSWAFAASGGMSGIKQHQQQKHMATHMNHSKSSHPTSNSVTYHRTLDTVVAANRRLTDRSYLIWLIPQSLSAAKTKPDMEKVVNSKHYIGRELKRE